MEIENKSTNKGHKKRENGEIDTNGKKFPDQRDDLRDDEKLELVVVGIFLYFIKKRRNSISS